MHTYTLHSLRIDYPDRYLAAIGLLSIVGRADPSARMHWITGAAVLQTEFELPDLMHGAAVSSADAWQSPAWQEEAGHSHFSRLCMGQEKFTEGLQLAAAVVAGDDRTRAAQQRAHRPGSARGAKHDRIREWIDAPAPLYEDNHGMMGFSPRAYQPHAYHWIAPANDPRSGCSVTLWLIGECLDVYTTIFSTDYELNPARRRWMTVGWLNQWEFRWPQWTHPLSLDTVRSLVNSAHLLAKQPHEKLGQTDQTAALWLREAASVCCVWRSTRQHRGHNRGGLMSYGVSAMNLE